MEKEPNSERREVVSRRLSIKYAISWQNIKDWIISFITSIVVALSIFSLIVLFLNILNSFLGGYFPKEVGKSLVIDILKSIIQINGVLVGLNGIIYAQLLRSVDSLQNTITRGFFKIQKNQINMANSLKVLESKRRSLILALLIITILYLSSIYLALAHIARTEKWAGETVQIYSFIYLPTLLLFSATVISMIIASTIKLTIPETEDGLRTQ